MGELSTNLQTPENSAGELTKVAKTHQYRQ